MTPALLAQLKADEGFRRFPYRDALGTLTVGYGRNLDDVGISAVEADFLLQADARVAESACAALFPWFPTLTEARQIVITSMMFNLGPERLAGFHQMLSALGRADYVTAAQEMRASVWASQVGARAERLAVLMETGQMP